jgi:hypothetical protein
MAKHLQSSDNKHPTILSAEKDGEDGILVSFSDGTVSGYVVEELLRLRPFREKVGVPVLVPAKKRMQNVATVYTKGPGCQPVRGLPDVGGLCSFSAEFQTTPLAHLRSPMESSASFDEEIK